MSDDDAFFDSNSPDRTVLRPSPGGRRGEMSQHSPSYQTSGADLSSQAAATAFRQATTAAGVSGLNPLVAAANVLLLTAGQLRKGVSHPDAASLHGLVAREISDFDTNAQANGVLHETIVTARYILCTFVDELVLSTPWGSQSAWNQQTLLSKFHNEVGGGEKFYQILDKAIQDPSRNIELLELMFICLSLGFKGKYRVQTGGLAQLADIQHKLMATLHRERGDMALDLSPHWRGVEDTRNPLVRYVPLWVVSVIAVAILLLIWFGLNSRLSNYSDPVMVELQSLGKNIPPMAVERTVVIATKPPRSRISVAQLLAAEISQGIVYVNQLPGQISIVIQGAGLFAPARATLMEQRVPLIRKIAVVLEKLPGPVLVTGHTDSDPIRGALRLKYATNWDLSQKRAEAIASVLKVNMKSSGRVTAEGLAATEPLVANDSKENKARNRRVEISVSLARLR